MAQQPLHHLMTRRRESRTRPQLGLCPRQRSRRSRRRNSRRSGRCVSVSGQRERLSDTRLGRDRFGDCLLMRCVSACSALHWVGRLSRTSRLRLARTFVQDHSYVQSTHATPKLPIHPHVHVHVRNPRPCPKVISPIFVTSNRSAGCVTCDGMCHVR